MNNEFHYFICCGQQFDKKSTIDHLKEKHCVDLKGKFTRNMLAHIDARDWCEWCWEWDFGGGIKVTEVNRSKR
uniref:C2H2-type domain-containing protein n=1 Tax=viral metagenome TaxID=1070528 RepID=A0A6M3LMU1_9ZZZZ